MRLLGLELKRVLKTRTTYLLAAVAVVLSLGSIFLVASYENHYYIDESGNEVRLTGREAIRKKQEVKEDIPNLVTAQVFRETFATYHAMLEQYGGREENVPRKIWIEQGEPLSTVLGRVTQVYGVWECEKITPDMAEQFYEQRKEKILAEMTQKYEKYPQAVELAVKMDEEVETPFTFSQGYGSNALDYLTMIGWLVVVLCAVISAPVFSADYQNGSDDILRCTRYGRARLAAIKIASALLISGTAFLVCITVFTLGMNAVYGWKGLDTSIQMLSSTTILGSHTVGEMQKAIIVQSFLSLLATVSATLFLSSRIKNPATTLGAAFAVCLAPFVLVGIIGGNLAGWIAILLPSGAVGMHNSYYYSIIASRILNAGDLAVWAAGLMPVIAAVEIPLFIGLTIYSYCRYEGN